MEQKKVIFSGIQPSGGLTLGNYIGALRNWKNLQAEYDCYYCVVDLHAVTVRQVPAELRRRTYETFALLLALGLDPQENTVFVQSHVAAHSQMCWALNCYTYYGELGRMTQFKEKSERHPDNINAGLFDYPVLMAGDILLYNTDLVPVGADQKQHLEITRDIAIRFNNIYGDVFRVPEPYIPKLGARVMSLQEPTKKMSKSDENENGFIAILDDPDVIVRKLRRAVTDSEGSVTAREDKPGVTNLMGILGALSGQTMEQIEDAFAGKGYGDLKSAVADAVIGELSPIQAEYKRLIADKGQLEALMKEGREKAARVANRTMSKVYRKMGFIGLR
ncbi:tryptophan--tRNA ligase [Christensenella sp. MSJ-20]|uniref:tryptophan--tRNA ligase n=1 Tax=Christensenella sp. MSJ-20 TaxID=2841518 RepID=UPI001C74CB64|nr:tryptophan--tRNA ligase [Christensenella sp. MSJ-20]